MPTLAVAEVYESMSENRAWRPAHDAAAIVLQLREAAPARSLDARAVDAVLTAAGQPQPAKRSDRSWPCGLTDREVDVLKAITRGVSNKEVARTLFVSQATVKTHLINVYGKIGVNTRAGATLFAFEHDLIDSPPR
jgi:DNA-binding NarL/FixJ family response regulator